MVAVIVGALALGPLRDPTARRSMFIGIVVAVSLFLLTALLLWPAGVAGHSLLSLRHYIDMAHDPWPVIVGGRLFERAPKWAYLYWYWYDFKPFMLMLGAGIIAMTALARRRKFTAPHGVLLAFTVTLVLAAHRSHIIGPEYLAHAIPFLMLVAGVFFAEVSRLRSYAGIALALAAASIFVCKYPADSVFGADDRALISRWPNAVQYLRTEWRSGDSMLAPQYGGVGRWYLIHVAGIPAKDWQVQALPPRGMANERLLHDISIGVYRYIAIGGPFSDSPNVDVKVAEVIKAWPVVWRSFEPDSGVSRLVLYERPRRAGAISTKRRK